MFEGVQGFDLTMEQQCYLRIFEMEINKMSERQLRENLLNMARLVMLKDNAVKVMFGQKLGVTSFDAPEGLG